MKDEIDDMPQSENSHPDAEVESTEVYTASQWRLMWWKFRKHRMAVWASMVSLVLYVMAVFCEFIAPYTLEHRDVSYAYAPPQRLHFVSDDGLHLWPFVYGIKGERHPVMLRKFYLEDKTQRYPIRLFPRGEPYQLWGLFSINRHLFRQRRY